MTDIVTSEKRSQMMSGIRGKNTTPEKIIRSGLHKEGLRFRLYDKSLPGSPDLVFRKYKAVIFVHGCFWHQHDCHLFKWPSSRNEFWKKKLDTNRANDSRAVQKLLDAGWRVGVIWECSLKGKKKQNFETIIGKCRNWLMSNRKFFEIRHTV